ncbi:helix-turn-helix domain-containing protein [Agrobacterium tumefaciens]|uniref:Helix-turn-helix transcriptional regulator n=1 Tax=Agrobacterium tumefaciens TaxID=358 RepID=A0AA44FBK8_AGRTU|nr:helix-turn-helix transcriptional regulator [Agrobacterium tumefaciens]NTB87764.1 helix-turn-helix transcriptional regulator [Agrobacterium tumefaciens]NTC32013.1 helix-turn-helix transcriptional regulator [Agrobacterium tumefaciens]
MKNDPHVVDVAIGRAIRKRRLLNGVSQSGLGEQIGVTFQQIQKYEKGTNRVSASMLTEIAHALHVDVRSFFDAVDALGNNGPFRDMSANAAEVHVTRETVSLNQAFAQISDPRLRRKIVDFVRAAAGATTENEHFQNAAKRPA